MRTSITRTPSSAAIKPLTPQYFANLIKLETDFANKTYTVETLDELMEAYSEAVEYYDSVKDSITSYFIFKIQDTLSKKKSFMLLMQEQAKIAAAAVAASESKLSAENQDGSELQDSDTTSSPLVSPSKGGRVSFAPQITHVIEEHSEEEHSDDEEAEIEMMKRSQKLKANTRDRKKSFRSLIDKNAKIFGMRMKMQNEKHKERSNLEEVLTAFGGSSQDNDAVVLGDIQLQKDKIRNRIAKKKNTQLMNYTQSSIGYVIAKNSEILEQENITIEGVLKQLDDEDLSNPSGNLDKSLSANGKEGSSGSGEPQESLKEQAIGVEVN